MQQSFVRRHYRTVFLSDLHLGLRASRADLLLDFLGGVDCGRIVEFHDEAIEARQKAIAEQYGFSLEDHALALYGRCVQGADCPYRKTRSKS